MAHADLFTLHEAATLAETGVDFVHKIVEDEAIDVLYERDGNRTLRMVDNTGVISIAVLDEADIPLPRAAKRNVFSFLSDRKVFISHAVLSHPDSDHVDLFRTTLDHVMPVDRTDVLSNLVLIPVSHHVFIDGSERMIRTLKRLRDYTRNRRTWIVRDPAIKGDMPVLKGTRMTVYSVEGRIRHGDSIEDIAHENPDIPMEALETALLYARSHPLVGRPSNRPWRAA